MAEMKFVKSKCKHKSILFFFFFLQYKLKAYSTRSRIENYYIKKTESNKKNIYIIKEKLLTPQYSSTGLKSYTFNHISMAEKKKSDKSRYFVSFEIWVSIFRTIHLKHLYFLGHVVHLE